MAIRDTVNEHKKYDELLAVYNLKFNLDVHVIIIIM